MPPISQHLIRAALLHLLAGFTLGALLLANKVYLFWPWLWRWLPAHYEFLLVGWTLQLIMGVGFWILPRFGSSRGDERLVWLAFIALNLGVLLVAFNHGLDGPVLITPIGHIAEFVAVLAFMINVWPRIKPLGG